MVANIRGYTPNYSFKLINFDTPRWHTLEYSNWNMVDAMFLQNGTPQMRGVWQNNTAYLEGDRVFDEETSAVYRCLVEHESAELGTFVEDRTLHPTYWSLQLSGTPVYRGEWLPGVTYVLGDIVYIDQYEYFLCTQGNVSSGTFPADAVKWQTIFDATQVVTDAEAAKDAAYQFSLNASTSADNALESENNAETAETDAEAWANDARAASGAFRWAFSTDTAAADPAVGRLAFNTATPATVTEIYLSAQSSEAGNPDVSAWVETWDDSTNPNSRGTLQVRKVGAPEQFLIFNLTGSITDNGSWLRLPVAYVSHSGSLTNAEPLSVGFVRAGNVGPTGTGGGDMLIANNLSELTVTSATARANIGVGPLQIPTFSQVLLGNAPSADMHAATKTYVDASPSLYISDTAPAGVQDGSLWWDSDRGTLLVRYNDGSSTQWVDAVAIPGLDTTSLVKKAGDTMTGILSLVGNPVAALDAAPKQYVDTRVSSSVDVRAVRVKVISASGTYTPDPNLVSAIVEVVGGGGGGGCAYSTANQTFVAGGGASGGYSRKYATAAQIGASQAVTIGAGGAGGIYSGGPLAGSSGGATSFGSLCTASGGGPGLSSSAATNTGNGGAVGAAGVGDFTSRGSPGFGGSYNGASNSPQVHGGGGGNSVFGGGGLGSAAHNTGAYNGEHATGPGGGGAGSTTNNNSSAVVGGSGWGGLVIVTEFCSQ